MAAQLPPGKGISRDGVSFFSAQKMLRDNFGWSVNLRARNRPREFFEMASMVVSKREELMRLILLQSYVTDKN